MVTISITAAAFEAIAATLPLGSVGWTRIKSSPRLAVSDYCHAFDASRPAIRADNHCGNVPNSTGSTTISSAQLVGG